MFSIIIPTMQKDLDVLGMLLSELQESPYVGEIILIDNANKALECNYSKLKVFPQKQNLFVNPAWNLGIKLSSKEFEYFGIINDDLIFSKGFLSQVHEFIRLSDSKVGLVGIDCVTNTPKAQFDEYKLISGLYLNFSKRKAPVINKITEELKKLLVNATNSKGAV